MQVVLPDDAGDRDHVALARLDLVEELLLAGQPEPPARLDLDARAFAFGTLGHHEGAALRAAGDGHADRVLGNGTLFLRREPDAQEDGEEWDSVLHSYSLSF